MELPTRLVREGLWVALACVALRRALVVDYGCVAVACRISPGVET